MTLGGRGMRDLFHFMRSVSSGVRLGGRHLAATIRGPVLWLTLCGGLLVTAIFAGTIMMTAEFRERALRNNERELRNAIQLLTRHFDEQFENSDAIAADVIARLRISDIDSTALFSYRIASLEIQGRRAVVSRRHIDFRRRRRDHQLVEAITSARARYFRPQLLSGLQVGSAGPGEDH